VKSVIIKYDETKQKSRCFGFIEFDNEDSMQGVIRDKDDPGHTIDGKKIDPKIAQPPERQKPLPSSAQKVKKIFVGGVPPDLPESDIWEYFVQFGEVRVTLCLRGRVYLLHTLQLSQKSPK
jgi:RNA recognition motif-containing protein